MKPTYHDVVVYVDNVPCKPSEDNISLNFTKAGWQLWNIEPGRLYLIGEAHGSKSFRIEVGGIVICETEAATGE